MNEARTVKVARERRYMTCCLCGRDWNVSLNSKVKESQYICPTCWQKQHRALQRMKGGKHK